MLWIFPNSIKINDRTVHFAKYHPYASDFWNLCVLFSSSLCFFFVDEKFKAALGVFIVLQRECCFSALNARCVLCYKFRRAGYICVKSMSSKLYHISGERDAFPGESAFCMLLFFLFFTITVALYVLFWFWYFFYICFFFCIHFNYAHSVNFFTS